MTKSERMKPVKRIADIREQDAAKVVAEYQQALAAQQQRLAELNSYRDEYIQTMQVSGSEGISVVKLRQYQNFLAKLNLAIEEQQKVVRHAEYSLEQKRQQWSHTRGKKKALGKVIHQYRQDEQRQQARKEQKESDEQAQQRSGRAASRQDKPSA